MGEARHLALVEVPREAAEVGACDEPLEVNALFRRFAPYVAAVGLRLLGRRDEVDDLVQDVFLDAHRARGKLRVLHEAKKWLTVVTVRRARRRLRARRRWAWLGLGDGDDAGAAEVVAPGATPEAAAFAAEMYRALDRLPVADRLAWTLRYIQGEELKAVAELLECSLATAKRRIAAAQEALAWEVTT
jgi:RNA polymerase sigma-70 factor (ECF subfamily)